MRVNQLYIPLTKKENYIIVEFTISFRKGNWKSGVKTKPGQMLCPDSVRGSLGKQRIHTEARWGPLWVLVGLTLMRCRCKKFRKL